MDCVAQIGVTLSHTKRFILKSSYWYGKLLLITEQSINYFNPASALYKFYLNLLLTIIRQQLRLLISINTCLFERFIFTLFYVCFVFLICFRVICFTFWNINIILIYLILINLYTKYSIVIMTQKNFEHIIPVLVCFITWSSHRYNLFIYDIKKQ